MPLLIAVAPSWGWVVAANALLGVNQGLAWSMTVLMKIDLVGPAAAALPRAERVGGLRRRRASRDPERLAGLEYAARDVLVAGGRPSP